MSFTVDLRPLGFLMAWPIDEDREAVVEFERYPCPQCRPDMPSEEGK